MKESNIRSKKWRRKAIPIPIWLWGNFWFSCGHEARRKCDVQNFIELFNPQAHYKEHTVVKNFIELKKSAVLDFSVCLILQDKTYQQFSRRPKGIIGDQNIGKN